MVSRTVKVLKPGFSRACPQTHPRHDLQKAKTYPALLESLILRFAIAEIPYSALILAIPAICPIAHAESANA